MFDLRIERREGAPAVEVIIGAHREYTPIDFSTWSVEDYAASWRRACAHVAERGYARFLLSVCQPGTHSYTCLPCRRRGADVMLFKSILLPSLTEDFAAPEDAETLEDDYAERNNDEPNLNVYKCEMRDIFDFELRLRGGAPN